MAFWDLGQLALQAFRPGIRSKAEIGEGLIMACMEIGPGMEDRGHEHSFDQCGVVIEGEIEMFVGQEHRLLRQNEAYFIPSGERHGWKTFERPVKVVDVTVKQPPK